MALSTLFAYFLAFLLSESIVRALSDGRYHANMMPMPVIPKVKGPDGPVTNLDGTILPPLNTVYHFDQLIDHTNPGLGTFKQRYWHTWEWYKSGMAGL
jgi:hypothetical protein